MGSAHEMIVTISVRVCSIHEPWNHCPLIIEDGMCDSRFCFYSCWLRAWTMAVLEIVVGHRTFSDQN